MERIWTTQLGEHIGERVRMAGWLHRFRQQSQVSFLVLRDGMGTAQVVVEDAQAIGLLASLHNESVIEVEGVAVAEPQAPGGVEVRELAIRVISPAVEAPP